MDEVEFFQKKVRIKVEDVKKHKHPTTILLKLIYDSEKYGNQPKFQDNIRRIQFFSNFESGNLKSVFEGQKNEFFLYLKSDPGNFNTNWFYFCVFNIDESVEYTFHITNIVNRANNYRRGQKAMIFSRPMKIFDFHVRPPNYKELGSWKRFGKNVYYYKTSSDSLVKKNLHIIGKGKKEKERVLHTFSFSYKFPSRNKIYFISYGYPFTFSDLQKYLRNDIGSPVFSNDLYNHCNGFSSHVPRKRKKSLKKNVVKAKSKSSTLDIFPQPIHVDSTTIARSILGYPCSCLTVRSKRVQPEYGIIICGRQHSGESCSSLFMKGVMDHLTKSQSITAVLLREFFIIKIVPMVNIDGVVIGANRNAPTIQRSKTRENTEGKNLNRIWGGYTEKKKKVRIKEEEEEEQPSSTSSSNNNSDQEISNGCGSVVVGVTNHNRNNLIRVNHIHHPHKNHKKSKKKKKIKKRKGTNGGRGCKFSKLYPVVNGIEKMVYEFCKETKVLLFLDIHGHSGERSNFVYGYTSPENAENIDSKAHMFPRDIQDNCHSMKNGENVFEYDPKLIFGDLRGKKRVAPWVMNKKYGIPFCYTIELSMCGSDEFYFNFEDYESFGKIVLNSVMTTFGSIVSPDDDV